MAEAAGSAFDGMDVVPADGKLIEDVATGSISVVDEEAREEADEVYSPVVIREKVFAADAR